MEYNNRRILIVDDNPSIHEDIKTVLSPKKISTSKALEELEDELFGDDIEKIPVKEPDVELNYEMDSAFQGEEALEMVTKAWEEKRPYALIFMDVRMPPGIDGIETIKRVWDKFDNVEIVINTAYSDYSWDQIIDKVGKTDRLLFLKKPFESVAVQQLALSLTKKWNNNSQRLDMINNLEDIVEKRTQELEDQRSKAVYASKMASLGEMAAGIAHEVNNPLTVVLTSAELLTDFLEDPNVDMEKDQICKIDGKPIKQLIQELKAAKKTKKRG